MNVPFNQTSFGEALIRSREEEKAIFAYFYSESISEQETALGRVLSVKTVKKWIESNTVPIFINVDKRRVVTINNVPVLPWCVFLKPNLRQIGQIYDITQVNTESRFIALAKDYVKGEDSLPHAKKCITNKDPNNPLDWLILARVYSEWGYKIKAEEIILDRVQRRVEHRHCFSYIQGAYMWGLFYDCFQNSDRMKASFYKKRNHLYNQIIRPDFNNSGKLLEFVRLNQFLTEGKNTMDLYEELIKNKAMNLNTLNYLMKIEYMRFYHMKMYTELVSSIDFISMAKEAIITYQEEKKWILESVEENNCDISVIESLNTQLCRQLCIMYEILLRNDEDELAGEIAERLLTILSNAESYSFLASFGRRTGNSPYRDLEYAQKAYDLRPDHITYASSLHGICLKILEKRYLKSSFREQLVSIIKNIEKDFPSLAELPTQSLRFKSGDQNFIVEVKKIDSDKK